MSIAHSVMSKTRDRDIPISTDHFEKSKAKIQNSKVKGQMSKVKSSSKVNQK